MEPEELMMVFSFDLLKDGEWFSWFALLMFLWPLLGLGYLLKVNKLTLPTRNALVVFSAFCVFAIIGSVLAGNSIYRYLKNSSDLEEGKFRFVEGVVSNLDSKYRGKMYFSVGDVDFSYSVGRSGCFSEHAKDIQNLEDNLNAKVWYSKENECIFKLEIYQN